MNAQRVKANFDRVNALMAKGEQYHGAYQWKLLKKARAKWNKKLAEFNNPKAKPRPLPLPLFQNRLRP